MTPPIFQIQLEQDCLTLRGPPTESVGCVLRGKLVLTTTKPIKAKEIKLTFQGKSKVMWTDGMFLFLCTFSIVQNFRNIIFNHMLHFFFFLLRYYGNY